MPVVKILFITRKYPPSTGGMEVFAYDLSRALADEVDLKLVKWGGRQGKLRAVFIASPYLIARAFWVLLRGNADAIHVQDGFLAPAAYCLSRLFRKPYGVVIHGLDITYTNLLYRHVPWAVRRAGVVFCISRAAAAEAIRHGVPQEKIRVIPLAVRDRPAKEPDPGLLKEFSLPADAPVLITVGRLVKRKGVAWFTANVLPPLVKQFPNLIYMVVGEGEDRGNIEAVIKHTGLVENVRLLGRVSDELREAAYARADIFVMPNIKVPGDMEGFGLVLLEAAVRGLPVVAADLEGISDAVADGKNGVLIASGDAAGFERSVGRFLDDAAQAKRFGAAGRRFTLATFSWKKTADRYIEAYLQLRRQTP